MCGIDNVFEFLVCFGRCHGTQFSIVSQIIQIICFDFIETIVLYDQYVVGGQLIFVFIEHGTDLDVVHCFGWNNWLSEIAVVNYKYVSFV